MPQANQTPPTIGEPGHQAPVEPARQPCGSPPYRRPDAPWSQARSRPAPGPPEPLPGSPRPRAGPPWDPAGPAWPRTSLAEPRAPLAPARPQPRPAPPPGPWPSPNLAGGLPSVHMSDRHISQHFETLAIHAGNTADPLTGAVVPPIYQVSTYKQDGVGGLRGGYEYSRSANPTRTALEENLAALEGGRRGLAFASGLAAEDCLLRTLLSPGDHVVIPNDAYGGTFRLFAKVVARWGVEWSVADTSDPAAVRAALTPKTKAVWVETPSNPLLGITDIAAVAADRPRGRRPARRRQHLRQPLPPAAAGARRGRRRALPDQVHGRPLGRRRRRAGHRRPGARRGAGVPPERDGRGRRALRLLAGAARHQDARRPDGPAQRERHQDRRHAHPARARDARSATRGSRSTRATRSPPSRCGRSAAWCRSRSQGGEEAAVEVCNRAKVFTLGESLGGVESLIEHPGRMTHASVAGSALEVPADLVRLSVGIENVDDLLEDLQQALG